MTQETQSAPRRLRSFDKGTVPASAGLSNSPLQRLKALVDTSPQVAQLKVLQKQGGESPCGDCLEILRKHEIVQHPIAPPMSTSDFNDYKKLDPAAAART